MSCRPTLCVTPRSPRSSRSRQNLPYRRVLCNEMNRPATSDAVAGYPPVRALRLPSHRGMVYIAVEARASGHDTVSSVRRQETPAVGGQFFRTARYILPRGGVARPDQNPRPAPSKAPKGCKGRNCNDIQQRCFLAPPGGGGIAVAPMNRRAQTPFRRRRHRRRIGGATGRRAKTSPDGADAIDVTADRILAAVLHLLLFRNLYLGGFHSTRATRPWPKRAGRNLRHHWNHDWPWGRRARARRSALAVRIGPIDRLCSAAKSTHRGHALPRLVRQRAGPHAAIPTKAHARAPFCATARAKPEGRHPAMVAPPNPYRGPGPYSRTRSRPVPEENNPTRQRSCVRGAEGDLQSRACSRMAGNGITPAWSRASVPISAVAT